MVACGGDDDDDAGAESTATATTEQADGGQAATAPEATPAALGGDEPTAAEVASTATNQPISAKASDTADENSDEIPLSALVIPPARDAEIPQNGRVLGNPDAAVSIVEYGDFQWPGCRQFARVVEPVIEETFVATGQAKFEYRDYAFLSEGSALAAEAARCADDQGAFWGYHDLIFYNVDNPQLPGLERTSFDLFALYLELDMESFGACMDNHTHQAAVNESRQQASAIGVSGTPAILLNGQLITGIESYDELFQMIEEAASAS